jgi:hypothetical protein
MTVFLLNLIFETHIVKPRRIQHMEKIGVSTIYYSILDPIYPTHQASVSPDLL